MPACRLLLVPMLLAALASPTWAKADTPIWKYQYGSTSVVWTRQDLQVRSSKSSKPSLSLRDQFLEEFRGDKDIREVESNYQVLSAVGPLLSLKKSFYADSGGAHPSELTTIEAVDLRKPRAQAVLTDYFPDQVVLAALLSDGLVKKALATLPPTPTPRTSMELLGRLVDADTGCEYSFKDDLLCAFAFHHVEGDKVAVRLALTHGAEACRGTLTQIGLLLPIPAALKADFQAAQSRKAGFLAKQGNHVHHGATTDLQYAPSTKR